MWKKNIKDLCLDFFGEYNGITIKESKLMAYILRNGNGEYLVSAVANKVSEDESSARVFTDSNVANTFAALCSNNETTFTVVEVK